MSTSYQVFSPADLQTIRTFAKLHAATAPAMTIGEVVTLLDEMLGQGGFMSVTPPKPAMHGGTCPSCGLGVVTKWERISLQVGGPVFGCTRCQWSEVR